MNKIKRVSTIVIIALIVGLFFVIHLFIQDKISVSTLEEKGYTNISLHGIAFFHGIDFCNKGPRIKFTAEKDGKFKSGYVCPYNIFLTNIYED